MQNMMLDLVTNSAGMAEAWEDAFRGYKGVAVHCCDFRTFIDQQPEIDAVVSPANAYGLMDGNYDRAITDKFGPELAERVRTVILERFYGEQPVGTSFSVPIPGHENILLIHTPTMRAPTPIADPPGRLSMHEDNAYGSDTNFAKANRGSRVWRSVRISSVQENRHAHVGGISSDCRTSRRNHLGICVVTQFGGLVPLMRR